MTTKEAKEILLDGFKHSEETREYFYLKKAKESGCPDSVFFKALINAYNQVEKYLNLLDYSGICCFDDGTEGYQKINNITIQNGNLSWQLTHEELPELLPTLLSLGKKIDEKASAKNSPGTQAPQQILKSFDSTMTDEQIKKLFSELQSNNIKFIHPETNLKQFTAIFKAEAKENIKPVKWLKYKPQLFYLLNGLIDKNLLTKPENLYKYIDVCFVDKTGEHFKYFKQSYNTLKNITDFNCRYSDVINELLTKVISL